MSLRVTSAKGKTVSTASIGEQETGKLLTYLWKCNLGKGKYEYSILATDLAGNKASKAGKNTLTVRQRDGPPSLLGRVTSSPRVPVC